MSKQPREYLKHILDEIDYLLDSSVEISEEVFMRDKYFTKSFFKKHRDNGGSNQEVTKRLY